MTERRLFDPGLQPERTELAWRRTALAIGIGSLLALRVLPFLGTTAMAQQVLLAPGIIGTVFAVALWIGSRARNRHVNRALLDDPPHRVPGAGLLLVLTVFVIGCGLVSAAVVLLTTTA